MRGNQRVDVSRMGKGQHMAGRRKMVDFGAADERSQPPDNALGHVGRQTAREQQHRHLDAAGGRRDVLLRHRSGKIIGELVDVRDHAQLGLGRQRFDPCRSIPVIQKAIDRFKGVALPEVGANDTSQLRKQVV
jgi:hypothetical protein